MTLHCLSFHFQHRVTSLYFLLFIHLCMRIDNWLRVVLMLSLQKWMLRKRLSKGWQQSTIIRHTINNNFAPQNDWAHSSETKYNDIIIIKSCLTVFRNLIAYIIHKERKKILRKWFVLFCFIAFYNNNVLKIFSNCINITKI